ncbi:hypothetical protein ABMA28_012560 [Loxostege sticticalis]|uniref:C2H2-type domain-containing protein n=1 Tax=Loxostege sticticalis TaxID=481309 RepID=A0ABD0S852_LOXSC
MNNNICHTCLSKDRRLIPMGRIRDLLKEMYILEKVDENSSICWECHHIMLKFYKFKLQVHRAKESINLMGQRTQCLSNLSTSSKNYYDYQFTFHTNSLTHELDIKPDIKSEDETDFSENLSYHDETRVNTVQLSNEEKPYINEGTIEVFVDLYKAKNQPLNNENDDDVVDNSDSNFNNPEVTVSVQSPNTTANSDKYVPEIKIKSKRKVKKEIDKNIKDSNKKLKDTKSKRKKTEKESELDEEELKRKFTRVMYSEEEMQKHREEKRNHPNFKKIPFKCDSCVLGFTRKENLDIHMEKKHNQSFSYICDVCLTRFSHKRPLARHISTHFERYRCSLCSYETREMWSALNHCRAKHKTDEQGRLHCPHCDTEASTQEDLSEHIKTQHVLYCNECGEKFKGKNTLRTHKSRIHGAKRDFACEICHKTFKTKSRLESHLVTHNAAAAKKLAFCATCNVQYKNIYVYRNHLRTSANHSERA